MKAKTKITEISWTQARAQGHSPLTNSDMIYMLILTPALKAHEKEKAELRKNGRLTKPMQKRLNNKMNALCVAKPVSFWLVYGPLASRVLSVSRC